MSLTIANARLNVRVLLNDLNEAAYAISDERLTRVLVRQAQLTRGVTMGEETTVAVAISGTGGTDFSLATVATRVLTVRRRSDGVLLQPRTLQEMAYLWGQGSEPPAGPPTDYAPLDLAGLITVLRLHPIPDSNDTLDCWVQTLASAAYTDATTLEGSEYAMRMMELNTASEAAVLIPPPERQRINLDAAVVASWKADARTFERLERERWDRLRSVSHIPAQVN